MNEPSETDRSPAPSVFFHAAEGYQIVDPDYRLLYVNAAAARHLRRTRDELVGRTLMEVSPGIERTEVFSVLRQCLETRAPRTMDHEATSSGGSTAWFELRFEPVPEGVAVFAMDISAHRRAELALSRSHRALAVLSECNQALVRATDERQLIDDLCRILVDRRGYAKACVGLKGGEHEPTIRPLARAGLEVDHTELARLTWDQFELGTGPIWRAATTGRPVTAHFVGPAAEISDWHDAARRSGFASCVVLPIRNDGVTLGALAIYSAEPDAFDAAECALLDQMALDLGYGIATLRARVSRREAEASVLHLNSVLRGVRSVNQLITRERERDSLIQKACEILVESRGFSMSCIVLCDGERVVSSAFVGAPDEVVPMERTTSDHNLPECMRRALREMDGLVRHGATASCAGCPMRMAGFDGRDAVTVRIECEQRTFGALLVSLPPGMAWNAEEMDLLREVARDVAFALRSLELQSEHATAHAARQESEHRYRSLFDNATLGVAHCQMLYDGDDPVDFVYLDVNPTFEKLTGLKDVVGRKVSEVIPGIRTSDPRLFEVYGRVARSDTPERIEIYVDALAQWFDVSVYSPRPEHFVAVFDVITSRKEMEGNLVSFAHRLERLANVIKELSQARSVSTIVEVVRHAARALVGADGATFVLRDGDRCVHVDEDAIAPLWKNQSFPMSACICGWTMIHGQPAVIEDVYSDERVPHDAFRPTFVKSLAVVPVGAGRPVGAIGCVWATPHRATAEEVRILQALADATAVSMENAESLQALEDQRARTRAVYEHLPSPAFVWRHVGPGFVLADFNRAATTATDGAIADLMGQSAERFANAVPDLTEDLASCYQRRTPFRREAKGRLPGAPSPRQLVLSYGFIPPDMVILHTEDVTEQRETEEQLEVAQRLEAVGRLAGGVAHDFNNLLSVIISYAGFAADELRESDPIHADIVEIKNAGERAAALTRQLLAFSRKQVLEPKVLCLNRVVTDIERMLRRLLGEDVQIAVYLADTLGSVLADPGQIEQVLMNLAVNARDAMPSGGKLTIETADVDLDDRLAQERGGLEPGRFVMLSVTDTGTGIPDEVKDHVFEPFFTTKAKGKGTGLGLSTVYGIVNQSGGSIRVDSEVGRGSRFEVYLPRHDSPAPEARRKSIRTMARGGETILLVEDEPLVRRLAERILKLAGYDIHSAASGGDALILCEKLTRPIHLLLTDVVMPQMSGAELAERLRRSEPGLLVLFMSGYADNPIFQDGVIDPAVNYISKPFSPEDLTRKVREVLDGSHG